MQCQRVVCFIIMFEPVIYCEVCDDPWSEACSFTAADAGEPSLTRVPTCTQMTLNELWFIKKFIFFSQIHIKRS